MVYLIFFLSGVAALHYQVAWMKILTVEFGSTVYAVSTVLSVFMTGLALGSWLFGRRVDTGTRPLVLYAVLEFVLAGYALLFLAAIPLVHGVYVAIERALHPSYESFSLIKLAVSFLLLIVPTTVMGGTLPVLAKHIGRERSARGRRLGLLYSFNTLGAMAGAAGIAFVWILAVGVYGSIVLAVAINLALGGAALWLNRRRETTAEDAPTRKPGSDRARPPAEQAPARVATVIAFVSGLVILACEVLWTRLFTNFLSGNALIFATILIAVLAGLAGGGFLSSLLAGRIRRLAPALGASMVVGSALIAVLVLQQPRIGGLFAAAYRSPSQYAPFLTLFAVLVVPCTALGITFPVLLRWAGRDAATLGSDVGRLYAVNTLGSVLGSLAAGFLAIRLLGVNGSLLLLATVYAAAALLLMRAAWARAAVAVLVFALSALLLNPDIRRPRYWYNGGYTQLVEIPPSSTDFLEEGVSSTVGVARIEGSRHLTVNGLIVAETRQHDLWDLLSKAHLPMLIHPDPRRVALVGLGAGISLGATAKYDVDRLDCIELSPEVVRACRRFDRYNQNCLDDERLDLVVNDGRHYLMTTEHRYDVINVDPIDPPVCTLYTQDFFQVCHDRLDDGGLMVQWVPVFRLSPDNVKVVFNAFLEVFEHSSVWYNGTAALLIGRRGGPLSIDVARFRQRALDPRVRESLALIGDPDPWMLLSMYVGDAGRFREIFPGPIPDNTDDRPYLEYTVLRTPGSMVAKEGWTLQMVSRFRSPLDDVVMPGTFSAADSAAFMRMKAITDAFYQARMMLFEGRQQQAEALLGQAIGRYRISRPEIECLKQFYALGSTE